MSESASIDLPKTLEASHEALKAGYALIHNLQLMVDKLTIELQTLRRAQFGRSSEASAQLPLFDDEGNEVELPEPQDNDDPPKKRRKPRVAKRLSIPEGQFEEREEVIDVPEDEREGMEVIGQEITRKLGYEPGRFFVRKIIRPKYAHPKLSEQGVRVATLPPMTIDQGIADASLLAHLCIAKYDDHLPLYRINEGFGRAGLTLPRSTLSDWIMVSARWLKPLYQRMHQLLVQQGYIQTDETGFPLQQKGKVKKARAWVYLGHDPTIVLYDFTLTKQGHHARAFLSNWKGGYLQADAANTFDALYEKDRSQGLITEVGCWAHARRKFFKVAEAAGNHKVLAHDVVDQINELFSFEREWRDLTPVKRQLLREERSKPVLDALKQLLIEGRTTSATPKSPTGKAINYVLGNWNALNRYTEDGRLIMDNNGSERALRQVAIGRKNWLFAGSSNGGDAAVIIYSLIESAKANGHEPFAYLCDLLERLPTTLDSDLDPLLPHNWTPRS